MIRFLKGRLAERAKGYVVIDVGGVGFQVLTATATASDTAGTGDEICLHTRLNVREDALTLYGFRTPEEAALFDLLMTVSGVGPRVAMGVISACSPRRFFELMVFEDVEGLSRLPGLGKKLSQRLVLELRDKLAPRREAFTAADITAARAEADPAEEATEALTTLGYSRAAAAEAVERARAELGEGITVTDLLKRSLKIL